MQRHAPVHTRVLALGLVLALAGCKQAQRRVEARARCNVDELTRLAKQLEEPEPPPELDDSPAELVQVEKRLPEVCELSPTVAGLLRGDPAPDLRTAEPAADPRFVADKTRACPNYEALDAKLREQPSSAHARIAYETCDYARFDLLDVEQFANAASPSWVTWSTHALMIDAGAPAKDARIISRALFGWELATLGPSLIQALEGQRLAKIPARGELGPGTPVYVSMTELQLDDRRLAILADGRFASEALQGYRIGPLFDALLEEVERTRTLIESQGNLWDGRLIVVADERLPFQSLVEIIYTAGQAEFSSYAFVVEPEYPLRRSIEIRPPRFGELMSAPPLKAFVLDDGIRVSGESLTEPAVLPKRDGDWDFGGLARLARAHREAFPDARHAAVSADVEIPTGAVLRALHAMQGPDCEPHPPFGDGEGCVLPRLVIEAGAG